MITDELLFEVAIDHYYNNLLQKDIAEKLGVSRVQISKYIKLAHKRGIVNIEVIPPRLSEDVCNKYKKLFKKLFGFGNFMLVKTLKSCFPLGAPVQNLKPLNRTI